MIATSGFGLHSLLFPSFSIGALKAMTSTSQSSPTTSPAVGPVKLQFSVCHVWLEMLLSIDVWFCSWDVVRLAEPSWFELHLRIQTLNTYESWRNRCFCRVDLPIVFRSEMDSIIWFCDVCDNELPLHFVSRNTFQNLRLPLKSFSLSKFNRTINILAHRSKYSCLPWSRTWPCPKRLRSTPWQKTWKKLVCVRSRSVTVAALYGMEWTAQWASSQWLECSAKTPPSSLTVPLLCSAPPYRSDCLFPLCRRARLSATSRSHHRHGESL